MHPHDGADVIPRSRDIGPIFLDPPGGYSSRMKTLISVIGLTFITIVSVPHDAAAQDLTIVNARILDGKGGVIERGSVVVRSGKIESVGTAAPPAGGQRIDAQGRTVMPGFIDAHRHIATGDPAEWLAKRAPAQM